METHKKNRKERRKEQKGNRPKETKGLSSYEFDSFIRGLRVKKIKEKAKQDEGVTSIG